MNAEPTPELLEHVRLLEQARDLLDDRQRALDEYLDAHPEQVEAMVAL